jgi:hypothetical protein
VCALDAMTPPTQLRHAVQVTAVPRACWRPSLEEWLFSRTSEATSEQINRLPRAAAEEPRRRIAAHLLFWSPFR